MRPHDVLKKLVLTEDTYSLVESASTFVFRVPREVNKVQIRVAVTEAFGVKVMSVNTLVPRRKERNTRGQPGKKGLASGYKKAFIKVVPEDVAKIPLI